MRNSSVGLTVLKVKVGNPAKPKVLVEMEFLVDSGAIYSVVPSAPHLPEGQDGE